MSKCPRGRRIRAFWAWLASIGTSGLPLDIFDLRSSMFRLHFQRITLAAVLRTEWVNSSITGRRKEPFLISGAAAKSLQSYSTLWNPIDGSPPGSPVPGILQARTLEWVAISFPNA